MPNVKKLVDAGACREDLVMPGLVTPTVTSANVDHTGYRCQPGTHGITCFWNQDPDSLDTIMYNLDSRMCKAEQLWNVTAEAGKKTLVWHWPVLPGRHLLTAQICMLSMVLSRQLYR